MALIDTHSHIYAKEFQPDQAQMIERADKAGIIKILMPAIDSTTHQVMLQIEEQFPDKIKSMMGVHPCSVRENYVDELNIAEEYLTHKKFVAVGETGLDFYWDVTYKDQQYNAFQRHIEWALKYDIPVVIHSRNSTDECIGEIKKYQHGSLKGVFHCFSGSMEQAQQIIGLGFYLGIGGVVTFKNSGLDVIMKEIDLRHVILETDAPYLAPVPFRGKRNEPSYISYVADKLAAIKNLSVEEIGEITTGNANEFFKLTPQPSEGGFRG